MVLNPKLFLIIISFVFVVNTKPFHPVMDIGYYPHHRYLGINAPTCGLRYLPTVHKYKFKPKCFQRNISDQTIYDYEGNNLHFEGSLETHPKGRIWSGEDAEEGEGPWAVYIGWKPSPIKRLSILLCTGSLITFEWVLTAAHCKHFEDPGFHGEGRYVVIAGSTYYFGLPYLGGGHSRVNSKWIPHPYWDNPSLVTNSTNKTEVDNIKNFYDVSLIKLDKPFPQDKESGSYLINRVCLPSRNRSKGFPFKATNFGYGFQESPTRIRNVRPTRLKKAEYDVLRESHGLYTVLHGNDDSKTCQGDSGSGIVYYMDEYKTKAVLVGTFTGNRKIFAWWNPVTDCRSADFDWSKFAATYKFIDWILDTIANN